MPTGAEPTTPTRLLGLATWLLNQANVRAHRILSESLEDNHARGHQVRVLAALDELGSMSQVDLGRAVDLDRADVARVVDELERARLVRRRPDPSDGRRKLVSITPDGTGRQRELEEVLAGVQRAVLAPLTPADQETLLRLLVRLQP